MAETDPDLVATENDSINEEQREQERLNLKMFHNLVYSEITIASPININVYRATELRLPSLIWCYYDEMPKKMKLTNSGHTLILSAKWHGERPFLTGGPLKGKYVFSQAHFHWGNNALEGSEHSVEGANPYRLPIEIHAMHYKSNYLNQENALQYKDGVISIVYFYSIKSKHSTVMHHIVSEFSSIKFAGSTTPLKPFVITNLMYPFKGDYYLYWGLVKTANSSPKLMWLITRVVASLSAEQLRLFRFLLDSHLRPIRKSFRDTNRAHCRNLFLVNPATKFTNTTLSPVPTQILYERTTVNPICEQKCIVDEESEIESGEMETEEDNY